MKWAPSPILVKGLGIKVDSFQECRKLLQKKPISNICDQDVYSLPDADSSSFNRTGKAFTKRQTDYILIFLDNLPERPVNVKCFIVLENNA